VEVVVSSRRDFLKGVAATGGLFALGTAWPRAARGASAGKAFPAGTWGGNVPTACHDVVRDRAPIPQVAPSRRVDCCVVGGGLAGLSAAYKLRSSNIVLLEHLDRIGGHAVRDRWNDVWYSGAAAYFVEPEEPLDALYAELKLPMKKIHEPADSAILSWNHVIDTFGEGIGKLPYPEAARKDFARARADFEAVNESDDYPLMPIGDTTEASKAYDRMTAAEWILKDRKYHPAVKAYLDLYARSAFGAPSTEHVSAFAFVNFYASEFVDRYTFPGGNAQAAEILRDAIDAAGEKRILSGATAVSVTQSADKVVVTYVDRNGRPAAVECKTCIMAAPKYVARHVVKGIPADQLAAMSELRFGTYLVANVLCSSPISQSSYDTWTDVAPFADFIVADWVTRAPGSPPRTGKQVLTVYTPLGYANALVLADAVYDEYRNRIVDSFDLLFPGAAAKIEDVRLYRWGHALCHASPGWYTRRSEVARQPVGRVLFAHSDNQGLPAFESALVEGLAAAEAAASLMAT
jgi:oxygen-dependent protoporphyrinogen oxidase